MYMHTNRVLYKNNPQPGHRYRQIVAMEEGQFQVRIFEGDVITADPKFMAQNTDAEVYFHPTLQAALEDVEREFQASLQSGWRPYSPVR
jgi:hypothetical protein